LRLGEAARFAAKAFALMDSFGGTAEAVPFPFRKIPSSCENGVGEGRPRHPLVLSLRDWRATVRRVPGTHGPG